MTVPTHDFDKIIELLRKIDGMQRELNEIEQTLGRALSFPRYCDDQENFPGTTDADGVCTGDATPADLAIQAAKWMKTLNDQLVIMSRRD